MVNKYANYPETILGFAYRVSPRGSGAITIRHTCSPPRAPIARATRSLYATVSACNKLVVCRL